MTQRTKLELVIMVIGAVVAVVAAALLGLAGYAMLGPVGLAGTNAYLFASVVFGLVVVTLVYGAVGLFDWRDSDRRRPV